MKGAATVEHTGSPDITGPRLVQSPAIGTVGIFALLLGSVLLVGCRAGPVGAARPGALPLSDADAALRVAAREVVRQLPAGRAVVVANFVGAGGSSPTRLGVELAQRFSIALWQESNRAGDKVIVRDRGAGRRAVDEEMSYVLDRVNPAELLERFQADYAVIGTYRLDRGTASAALDLRAVSTSGADLKFAACCDLRPGEEEFYRWEKQERLPLSTATDSMTAFLCQNGRLDAVEIVGMETRDGGMVPANGRVRVGRDYRLKVNVKQECFLYVLGWDQTNGFLTVLFPGRGENPRTGKSSPTLPGGSGWIQAIAPAGYNLLKVVATTEDVGLESTGQNLVQSPQLQNELVTRIRALGAEQWGAASFGYYIEE